MFECQKGRIYLFAGWLDPKFEKTRKKTHEKIKKGKSKSVKIEFNMRVSFTSKGDIKLFNESVFVPKQCVQNISKAVKLTQLLDNSCHSCGLIITTYYNTLLQHIIYCIHITYYNILYICIHTYIHIIYYNILEHIITTHYVLACSTRSRSIADDWSKRREPDLVLWHWSG